MEYEGQVLIGNEGVSGAGVLGDVRVRGARVNVCRGKLMEGCMRRGICVGREHIGVQ